ncbi:MAG: surface carbohydrate biosynthesis protein [Thermodesulfobacteriota bacterium]|nr:surface carbohydrate biosynthesis protein [Thermodesulfobacteriota bacterium]
MNKTASTLIIPVESQVREMDAKLLLSCVAAERGFPVIMGSRAFIHFKVDAIPRGVYLAKSMRTLSIRMFSILRKLGHEIVAWDEEGLLREPDPEYYRWRLSPYTVAQVSHLIAWGEDDAQTLRNYPDYPGTPIHITGNPRIDMMRKELRDYYQPKVNEIRERFGDFVLVNTNFSKVNHFFPELSPLKQVLEAEKSEKVNQFDSAWGRHKLQLFEAFQMMLPELCKALPDLTVVVRPHPAENHAPWLAIAKRCNNIKVVNDGSVLPWLMASKVLIANSCTTQVEAAVLDRPTVSYQPVASENIDHQLPNAVSHQTFSLDELCSKAVAIVRGDLGPLDYNERRARLDQHIAALDGRLAADRIVDVLESAAYQERQPPTSSLPNYLSGWIRNRMRTAKKHVNMRRPSHRNNLAYHAHRWPDISVDEVERRIARLGNMLGRFKNIRVTRHSKHIFRIIG